MFTKRLTVNSLFTIMLFEQEKVIGMNKELDILCHNLRILKIKYRLNQKELAKIGNVSLTSIVKFLNNQPPARVGVDFLANIAEHFNLEIHQLFLLDLGE